MFQRMFDNNNFYTNLLQDFNYQDMAEESMAKILEEIRTSYVPIWLSFDMKSICNC